MHGTCEGGETGRPDVPANHSAWEVVGGGQSGASVRRRPGLYLKEDPTPTTDLDQEAQRLAWLRGKGIPAPRVVESGPDVLLMEEVPGVPAKREWCRRPTQHLVRAMGRFLRRVHSLPIDGCPFDERRGVVLPRALEADIDLDDLDDARQGWTRPQLIDALLNGQPDTEDLAVCHGDLTLSNIIVDPRTNEITGLIDVGRLGVADRWSDLAIVVRSLQEPTATPPLFDAVDEFLHAYDTPMNREKCDYYQLLDEFF